MAFDVSNLYRKSGPRRSTAHNAQIEEQIRDNMYSTSAHGYREEEAAKQYAAEQERLDAVRAAEDELSRNLTELRNEKKARALSSQDDPSIFSDPDEPRAFYSQAEATDYNRAAVKEFLSTTPEYYPDQEGKNLNTISDFLERNGHGVIVSAKKLRQVFNHLNDLGLMVQRPAPVAAPVAAPVPVQRAAPAQTVWDIHDVYSGKSSSDQFEGFDPHGSGQRVRLTARQIADLSVNEFKTYSRVTIQKMPDWARIDNREPDYLADQFVSLGRER